MGDGRQASWGSRPEGQRASHRRGTRCGQQSHRRTNRTDRTNRTNGTSQARPAKGAVGSGLVCGRFIYLAERQARSGRLLSVYQPEQPAPGQRRASARPAPASARSRGRPRRPPSAVPSCAGRARSQPQHGAVLHEASHEASHAASHRHQHQNQHQHRTSITSVTSIARIRPAQTGRRARRPPPGGAGLPRAWHSNLSWRTGSMRHPDAPPCRCWPAALGAGATFHACSFPLLYAVCFFVGVRFCCLRSALPGPALLPCCSAALLPCCPAAQLPAWDGAPPAGH